MTEIIVDNTHNLMPSKIICIGRNYAAHIAELDNAIPEQMVLFCKPASAISQQLHSTQSGDLLDYEGELCFVVKQGQFTAVGFGFDLTKRGLQSQLKSQGLPWERAKAFDGSAVFSQFVSISTMPEKLSFQLKRNNNIVQQGNSDLMLFKPESILAEINTFMQLNDGDIIMTGTPKGVGSIEQGDHFSMS